MARQNFMKILKEKDEDLYKEALRKKNKKNYLKRKEKYKIHDSKKGRPVKMTKDKIMTKIKRECHGLLDENITDEIKISFIDLKNDKLIELVEKTDKMENLIDNIEKNKIKCEICNKQLLKKNWGRHIISKMHINKEKNKNNKLIKYVEKTNKMENLINNMENKLIN